ncbi:MAG: TIGR01212 family radical SAM protein [Planctomycetota bacterium]
MLFYSFKNYLKDKFPGLKVYKIALDAGFTCPHRTSDTRTGGCIYCENRSFSPYAKLSPRPPIREQIARAMEFYRQRHKADKFIIYFQAYTNTLGPVDKLKALYDEALSAPDVVGLSIGTRPDCVPDQTLDLITGYTKRPARPDGSSGGYDVWLEYGLQSANDKTLEFINRGHKYADFEDAVKRTKERGTRLTEPVGQVSIAAHLILGLPGETKDDMLYSVQKVIDLGIDGIKLHHLYVAQNTKLAKLYAEGNIKVFTLAEYIPLVCDVIERLPPKMVIIRTTGELSGEYLIAPKWNVSKSAIIRMIEKELTHRGSYQGKKSPSAPHL